MLESLGLGLIFSLLFENRQLSAKEQQQLKREQETEEEELFYSPSFLKN